MIEKIFRWALFCAGIIMAIFAGYMFYIDKIAAGAAWLSVAVGFLCFATRVKNSSNYYDDDEDENGANKFRSYRELHDISILVADLAVMSLKNIGRTVKPGKKEIEDLENKVNNLLNIMPVTKSERDEINGEFNALKGKTQLEEKGRAFFNQLGIGN